MSRRINGEGEGTQCWRTERTDMGLDEESSGWRERTD